MILEINLNKTILKVIGMGTKSTPFEDEPALQNQ